ncbi:hypothetical protein PV327_010923 [Microctonus hyperodae]|uniref:Uncharacterized protein n=1 Tax=Microctonus hyperodae TaxID=165561 RepID=A0AA39EYB6_MICHY|nr:hypothetical protein PV327_010923 [Microctonus hyperodae]
MTEKRYFDDLNLEKSYEFSKPDTPTEVLDEEGLVLLKDPIGQHITVNSADQNYIIAPRQHPLLLKKNEKGGFYYLEKSSIPWIVFKTPPTCG